VICRAGSAAPDPAETEEYIHSNPVKAGLCGLPEEYKYSSAKFYETGIDEHGFIKHFRG
jgi:hypothetical protein